jgi:hypothetical protein
MVVTNGVSEILQSINLEKVPALFQLTKCVPSACMYRLRNGPSTVPYLILV